MWGDMPAPSLDALLVEACNRLATQSGGRAVLAFEAIDAADEATVETIAHILQRPGWLRLPLLFTMRGLPQGRVAELVYLLRRDEGDAAVMAIEDEATPAQEAASVDWTLLPADVLRVRSLILLRSLCGIFILINTSAVFPLRDYGSRIIP